MAFLEVIPNEHHTWGPKVFGGGHPDQRDEQRALADLPRYEAELDRLRELKVLDSSLERECAYVGNLVAWTRERLDVLATRRQRVITEAVAKAEKAEIRAKHGLPQEPRELSPDEYRDEQHRLEQEAHVAAMPKMTKAELDAIDPNMKTKAQLKAETDLRDPFLQAKLTGKGVVDAITAMRAGGRPL